MNYCLDVKVDAMTQVVIDEKCWTDKEIQEFSDTFYDASTVKDIAKYALKGVLNLGESSFIEGFGYIKVNGSFPFGIKESEKCNSVEIKNFDINWNVY